MSHASPGKYLYDELACARPAWPLPPYDGMRVAQAAVQTLLTLPARIHTCPLASALPAFLRVSCLLLYSSAIIPATCPVL